MSASPPHFKVVLLGNTGVGKTALVDRISKNVFASNHVPTVGAQFISVEICVEDHPCILEVWDTAGQEVFRSLVGFYTREAKGCFILFDLTKQSTYAALGEWFTFIHQNAPDAQVILFGNKKDLLAEREVPPESIASFVQSMGCPYFEGSAKTAQGVQDAFDKMGELVFAMGAKREQSFVELTAEETPRKGGCC
jgi:small GTP-binding protein